MEKGKEIREEDDLDRRLYGALGDARDCLPLPASVAGRFRSSVRRVAARNARFPQWMKTAACLVVLASFVSFAAYVSVRSTVESCNEMALDGFDSISDSTGKEGSSMNTKSSLVKGAISAVALTAVQAQARTIALWPIECDPASGVVDGRCAVNPDCDLVVSSEGGSGEDQTIGWNLPPNPDPGAHLFDPLSYTSFKTQGAAQLQNTNSKELLALSPTHDFTLEGFVKFDEMPTASSWQLFCRYLPEGAIACKYVHQNWIDDYWMWSLRQNANGQYYFVLYFKKDGDISGSGFEVAPDFADSWHHVAFVFAYEHPTDASKSLCRVYLDGELKMECANVRQTWQNRTFANVTLGGRGGNYIQGALDYWRLSNAALVPGEFLNCGTAGEIVPKKVVSDSKTVSYWKLDILADGGVDGRDSVGSSDLSAGNLSTVQPVLEGSLVVPVATDGVDGKGCCFSRVGQGARLRAPGLKLDVGTPFTIEAYLKPQRHTGNEPKTQFVFSTLGYVVANQRAWALELVQKDGVWKFVIFAQNGTGATGDLANNFALSEDVGDWGDSWKHLALVYDPSANANGTWKLYIDGELAGSAQNAKPVAEAVADTKFNDDLEILWRKSDTYAYFTGGIDQCRVSKVALTPDQFLIANDGAAATDIAAHWHLDVQNGCVLDGTDSVGSCHFQNVASAVLWAKSVADDSAVITNPDSSPRFEGDAKSNVGSVRFWQSDSLNRAYLVTSDPSVLSTIESRDGFTYEGWIKLDSTQTNWGQLLCNLESNTPGNSTRLSLRYNDGYGFGVEDNGFYQSGNSASWFAGTSGWTKNVWTHFAFTHYYTADNKSCFELFLDGVSKGVLQFAAKEWPLSVKWTAIGGNPGTSRSLCGLLDSVRLSRGVLQPSEFLNASAPAPEKPVAPQTLAYWSLDGAQGGALDMETSTGPTAYRFSESDKATASDAVARKKQANAEEAGTRKNIGSAFLAANGYLQTPLLGYRLDLCTAFTIEGWLKLPTTYAQTVETLCGTYDSSSKSGWKLVLDTTSMRPSFRIFARAGVDYTPIVDASFPECASLGNDQWIHIALAFDPRIGEGLWTLFANGKSVGSVENLWHDAALSTGAAAFALGSGADKGATGFGGGYDMWRASSQALVEGCLLYTDLKGLAIIVR